MIDSEKPSPPSPSDLFIEAFTEKQSALRAYCVSCVGDPEEAKDVFQKTCLVLWKKSSDWDPETPFLRWAFAVARFQVLAYVRDRSRDRLVFDDDVVHAMSGASEMVATSQAERLDALEYCLARLRPEQRETLTDYYVTGFKLHEIAERQGRKLNAVKVMMLRLRRVLGECMNGKLGTERS